MLVQCSSDSGPQLTAAFRGTGNDASRDEALALLAVVVEHTVFELTEIMVMQNVCTNVFSCICSVRQLFRFVCSFLCLRAGSVENL